MPEKKDSAGLAHDEAVQDQIDAAAETGNVLAKGSEANDGGFVQVEGDGWTDEQVAEREAALKLEAEEAKAAEKVNEAERKRLGLPEPEAPTAEEKKAEKLTAAMDAAVEAAQTDPSVFLKTKGGHDDASLPVLKHPDSLTERPADPPADLADQTGSLTNFGVTPVDEKNVAKDAAKTTKAATGPAMTTGVQSASN